MLTIRLSRRGAKNSLSYRMVVVDSKKKNSGKYVEVLGVYDPVKTKLDFDRERYLHWISVGAKISDKVGKIVSK